MDENRLLADEHDIPWRLPKDTAHFRRYTQGKWLLIGRRTFEKMQGWFTDHTPLVLTSQCNYEPSIGHAVSSVPHALSLAEAARQKELVCCGGGQVYAEALPYADKMVLTHIQYRFEPKSKAVYFPDYIHEEWQEVHHIEVPFDNENSWNMSFVTLERKRCD